MTPSPNTKNLEELLLASVDGFTSTKHLLMQLSVSSYLEKTKNLDTIEIEYPMHYYGPKDLYRTNKGNRRRVSTWPADVVTLYKENNRKICEIVEVESINLYAFWERFEKIWFKARKISEISANSDLNNILDGVQEVRFSVAMDASGIDEDTQKRLANQFRYRFNQMSRKSNFRYHKVYLLQDSHMYNDKLNANILDSFERGYPKRNEALSTVKNELLKAYKNMRRNPENIKNSYREHSLFWYK